MTKQETFDIVARHLLTQNAKAMAVHPDDPDDKFCAYRGDGGLKCAAGCLIPDEKYRCTFEGRGVWLNHGEPHNDVTKLIVDLGHDADLVEALQYIHDQCDVALWGPELSQIARIHGLSDAVVMELRGPAASRS